tara:strand:- start:384 stop:1658 length:1275 start_codon:yes stop_codon:yes gene_type:complete
MNKHKSKITKSSCDSRFIFNDLAKSKNTKLENRIKFAVKKNISQKLSEWSVSNPNKLYLISSLDNSTISTSIDSTFYMDIQIFDYDKHIDGYLNYANKLVQNKRGILYSRFNESVTFKNHNITSRKIHQPMFSDINNTSNGLILCAVFGYNKNLNPGGIHGNHAIAAFKHYDTLYCFNPWGAAVFNSGNFLPDFKIWNTLQKMYKCSRSIVYNGFNFQSYGLDSSGACVGFATDWGTLMYSELYMWQIYTNVLKMQKNYVKYKSWPGSQGENLTSCCLQSYISTQYNQFVEYLFNTYTSLFSGKYNFYRPSNRGPNMISKLKGGMTTTRYTNNSRTKRKSAIGTKYKEKINKYMKLKKLQIESGNYNNNNRHFMNLYKNSKWNNHGTVSNSINKSRNEFIKLLKSNIPSIYFVPNNNIKNVLKF